MLLQGVNQPRFAQACFTDDLNDLPHPLNRPLPAIQQQAHLVVPADERSQPIRLRPLQPADALERTDDTIGLGRGQEPADLACAGVCTLEVVTDERASRRRAEDRTALGDRFEPGRDVRRIAGDGYAGRAHLADRRPRVETGPRCQVGPVTQFRAQSGLQFLEQLQGRGGRPPGGVLMCDRIAEAGDDSLVGTLRDGSAEALDNIVAEVIEGGADSGLILGIEREECRGVEDR